MERDSIFRGQSPPNPRHPPAPPLLNRYNKQRTIRATKNTFGALTHKVTSAMQSVVMSMASATRHMNIPSLTTTMRRFEQMTDHLSARQAYATEALDHGRDVSAGQVDMLMARIVDRAGLDVKNEMPVAEGSPQASAASSMNPARSPHAAGPTEPPGLEERLAKLRNEHSITRADP